MSSLEKFLTALVGVALVTTLVLPKHKGPEVITAGGNALGNLLSKAMGN
jgi:hypothetical protein